MQEHRASSSQDAMILGLKAYKKGARMLCKYGHLTMSSE